MAYNAKWVLVGVAGKTKEWSDCQVTAAPGGAPAWIVSKNGQEVAIVPMAAAVIEFKTA